VVVGVVLIVLVGRLLVRRERLLGVWLRGVGVTLLVTVAVSGWHYARVWAHFGAPLVGNYDVASGFWWWQPPGYGTLEYFGRFGHVLVEPFYSALYGLPDGLYSSFWGDGMCGGVGAWSHRPPWNYDLMAAGYLLALLPSLGIGVGLLAALWQFLRRPQAEWYLLFGVLGGLAVAASYQILRYPYNGHARASYLLTGMLPVCALGALGLEGIARLGRVAGALLVILLGTWGWTAYTSFWIDPNSAATHTWAGDQHLQREAFFQARVRFRRALEADPHAVPPRLNLVRALLPTNEKAEARRVIEQVLGDHPDNPDALFLLAVVCQAEGRAVEGLGPLRRASELAPDHPLVYPLLGGILLAEHQEAEAIKAYRQALRIVPWDPAHHANLGLLLARTGLTEEALAHYRLAVSLSPGQPDWLADLAWLLATQEAPRFRDPAEALRLAKEACERTSYQKAVPLQALAAALAACGRFGDARDMAGRAAQAATYTGEVALLTEINAQVQRYAKGKLVYSRAPLRVKPYTTSLPDAWPTIAKQPEKGE
jgi:tetratricopeptide (TPR) repeat protein